MRGPLSDRTGCGSLCIRVPRQVTELARPRRQSSAWRSRRICSRPLYFAYFDESDKAKVNHARTHISTLKISVLKLTCLEPWAAELKFQVLRISVLWMGFSNIKHELTEQKWKSEVVVLSYWNYLRRIERIEIRTFSDDPDYPQLEKWWCCQKVSWNSERQKINELHSIQDERSWARN